MSSTTTHIDISDVLHGFDLMRARASDLRLVFRDLKDVLKTDIAEHFEEAEGPSGPWAPRAPSTGERAGHEALMAPRRSVSIGPTQRGRRARADRRRLLGRLRKVNAYIFKATSNSLTMTPRGPWAAVHQYGGVVGHGSKIPARPFLWLGDRTVRWFEEALHLHIMSGWLQ